MKTRTPPGSLLTMDEAAERLSVSRMTIWRMIQDGKLRAFKPRGSWRIRDADLERIIEGG